MPKFQLSNSGCGCHCGCHCGTTRLRGRGHHSRVPLAQDTCHLGRPHGLTRNYVPGPSKRIRFFAVLRLRSMARTFCWRQARVLCSVSGGFTTWVDPPCVPQSLPSKTSACAPNVAPTRQPLGPFKDVCTHHALVVVSFSAQQGPSSSRSEAGLW